MLTTSHPSSLPISIFLENPAVTDDALFPDHYDLKIILDSTTQGSSFEPFLSIIQFALRALSVEQVDQVLALPNIFTTIKPIIRRYILGEPAGRREPLNTDELEFEQQEITRAFQTVLNRCFEFVHLRVAVFHSENISPSAFTFLQRSEYRVPRQLQLDFYLTSEAFRVLKISQGFSTQIKRRHMSIPRGALQQIQATHQLNISLPSEQNWPALRNAVSLYHAEEMLYLSNQIESQQLLDLNRQAELAMARMYAWLMQNDTTRCHIYIHELQHLDLPNLPIDAAIRTLKAITVGYLCLHEFTAAENAIDQYLRFAQQHLSNRDKLLAEFYRFLARSLSGKLTLNIAGIQQLSDQLKNENWNNLAAFVDCSFWFNEDLIDSDPDVVVDYALKAIETYKNNLNFIGQSTAHHHISIVLGSIGEAKAAIVHLNKALALTQQIGLRERIHNSLNGLAFLLNGLGQTQPALEAVEKAYPLVIADGNFDQICTTLYNFALIAFYADNMHTTIQIIDDIFSVMEYRNMHSTRFRTKGELLALQAIAAYLDGDRRLPFAIKPQVIGEQPRSHEGEAFLRCIELITQSLTADEAEHFFLEMSEQFSHFRQNTHLDLLALRLLATYLIDLGEQQRAKTWMHQGLRQCKLYQLESREHWFKPSAQAVVLQTAIEPRQAIILAQRQLSIDALKLENGLLNTLNTFNDSALRSGSTEELLELFLYNLQRLANIRCAEVRLQLASNKTIQRAFENPVTSPEQRAAKKQNFPLSFTGGQGELSVAFDGDVIHQAHDATALVFKICERLSRSIEFLQERIDSFRLAYLDSLTTAYNRFAFEEDMERILTQQKHHNICLAFIDIDNFKQINDQLGHTVGDRFLQLFVEHLSNNLRADDRIYRLGGDEFLVSIKNVTLDKAHNALARFVQYFFARAQLSSLNVSQEINTGCSVGLLHYHLTSDKQLSKDELIDEADRLMYQAKSSAEDSIVSLSIH